MNGDEWKAKAWIDMRAERDAALARAEKSEKQHAADASYDAYLIYRAQRQAERLAKHALRYRRRLKQEIFARDLAEAIAGNVKGERDAHRRCHHDLIIERHRLRELLRDAVRFADHWVGDKDDLDAWRERVRRELEVEK